MADAYQASINSAELTCLLQAFQPAEQHKCHHWHAGMAIQMTGTSPDESYA